MANISKKYSEQTRKAKKAAAIVVRKSSTDPEEKRIFATFTKRAQQDFRPAAKKRA
ncbi:hypothetical protein J6524_16895 [Bradyrhizobium sp. WSM 1738]|uniref:hypothetical protein n=1 Tax=Bradyrhizobium hereditatis TaxID=2821405 RepID=UPI001CE29C43|nr:hypothetical protein [Bradyrhizobium hereditatis]MCA6116562.1 hypothetical protein [Bradyrhizobium hereditatis]